MSLKEIQESAMSLTDSQRAVLASELLCSLPQMLVDHDDGVSEARRRSQELEDDPAVGRTWDEIRRDLGR